MKQDFYIKVLNNFIGYGNPNADLWFIGLDEYGSSDLSNKEKEIKRLNIYEKKYCGKPFHLTNDDFISFYEQFPEEIYKYSSIYTKYMEIVNSLASDKITVKEIGSGKINLFVANIFPLGRNNTEEQDYDPFISNNIFDGNFNQWYNLYWEARVEFIRSFLNKYNQKKIIVCFGTSYLAQFNYLFDSSLIRHERINIKQNSILVCYHPSRRNRYFTEDYKNRIIKKLKDS